MTRGRLSTLAVALAAACCSLPLASAATIPLGSPSPAATAPSVPVLGYAAVLPDRGRTVTGHFLADGSRLTVAASDDSGTGWRVTLEPGASAYPLDVRVTPLAGAAVWGSPLHPTGGILIEPATELAVPAEVTAIASTGATAIPTLVANVDGRSLRLAPHALNSPSSAALSRLGVVLTGDVPAAVATAHRAAVLTAIAAVRALPVPGAATPPDLPPGCSTSAELDARRSLTDTLVAADLDPERSLVEQLAATAQATAIPVATDAALATALGDRVAERLTASVDAARTGPARGAARFDAAASVAESLRSLLSLFPATAPPPPTAAAQASPTPGVERTRTDPVAGLAAAIAAWASDLTAADAASLAAQHDYAAPARVASRQRLVEQLGIQLPDDAVQRLVVAERYHLTLDVRVASPAGAQPAVAAAGHLDTDLEGIQTQTTPGAATGQGARLGGMLACASPPVALLGADSFGAGVPVSAGQPDASAVDAAVRSAFARQLAGSGLLAFPLNDGASPAVDATLTGTGALPGRASPVDVAVHALLTHLPSGG